VRIKGFVRTRDGVSVVQGVGRRVTVEKAHTEPAEDLVGRVVVIRRN
jgi:hypothetical protein